MRVAFEYKNKSGIRVQIQQALSATGPGSLILRPLRERNRIVADSLRYAGGAWIRRFLPQRFTRRMEYPPFYYPKVERMKDGFILSKAKATGLFQKVISSGLRGWNPWLDAYAPREVVDGYRRFHGDRYKFSKTGKFGTLYKDVRKWAKELVMNRLRAAAEKSFLPLVASGDLRDKFAAKANARATATRNRCRLTVTIPRGDRQNRWAVRVLGMVPQEEFNYIIKQFGEGMKAHLAGTASALPSARGAAVRGGTTATRIVGGSGPQRRVAPVRGSVTRGGV